LLGRVRAGARHDRYAAARLCDAPFDDALMFVMRQSWAFARGADGHETFGAFRDLPIDQVAKRFLVQGTVLEWRDQRSKGASKARLGGHDDESFNERGPVAQPREPASRPPHA